MAHGTNGTSPSDDGRPIEPGLPWFGPFLNAATGDEREVLLASTALFCLDGEHMAPHFPAGTVVATRRVLRPVDVTPGVYVWEYTDEHGQAHCYCARFYQRKRGRLLLTQDNGATLLGCVLQWSEPTFRLYQVVSYVSYPIR